MKTNFTSVFRSPVSWNSMSPALRQLPTKPHNWTSNRNNFFSQKNPSPWILHWLPLPLEIYSWFPTNISMRSFMFPVMDSLKPPAPGVLSFSCPQCNLLNSLHHSHSLAISSPFATAFDTTDHFHANQPFTTTSPNNFADPDNQATDNRPEHTPRPRCAKPSSR